MRVAVDGIPLLGARTGVGEVTDGIIRALARRDDVEVCVYAITRTGRTQLHDAVPPDVSLATSRFPARVAHWLWARVPYPHVEHWTGPVDIVHATNFLAPPARVPTIVTVHDLGFVRYPELCLPEALHYRGGIAAALERGAVLHTPSEYVAAEARAEFGVEAERVVAIPNGLPPVTGGDPYSGRRIASSDRYLLALGTVEPRKNLPRLVRAFDAVAAADPDLGLVIAGADGPDSDRLTAAVEACTASGRVRRLGYVSIEERRDLLAGASVFAYPSLYEGFGLPPLEAMAVGVPVLAADTGSLPEVLGDAAVLVDPEDVDGIAGGLHQLLNDEALRLELVARGRERSKSFDWDATAARLVELYRELI